MSSEMVEFCVSLAIGLSCLILALNLWRQAMILWVRERAFEIRADLFDAAVERDCLDDEAYRAMRQQINGLLRWVDDFTGVRMLVLFTFFWLRGNPPATAAIPTDDSAMAGPVREARHRLGKLIGALAFTSICGLLFFGIALAVAPIKRLSSRMFFAHVARLGTDDEYARNERSWGFGRHRPSFR